MAILSDDKFTPEFWMHRTNINSPDCQFSTPGNQAKLCGPKSRIFPYVCLVAEVDASRTDAKVRIKSKPPNFFFINYLFSTFATKVFHDSKLFYTFAVTETLSSMKMQTYIANTQRGITDFVNANGISKEMIINIFQSKEGEYILNYFVED